MSTHSTTTRDKNGKLVEHLRSMQQMERDTQETLSKFMSALSQRSETDYAALLEDKIAELQQVEQDNARMRAEMDQYEDRIEQLQKTEDRLVKEKGHIMDEKLRAGKAATQADQIIKNLQSQMRSMDQKHAQDLETKTSMLRSLEEENLTSKVNCDEATARLASLTLETSELHSAMASLHGEISAQQRELDEAKERDARYARQKKELSVRLEEKDSELLRLKSERRNLEARLADAEKKVADAQHSSEQVQQEGKTQVDQLVRERETVQGSLAKLSHKLRQQSDTSKELNSALNRMRIELSNAQEDSSRSRASAEASARDVQSLQILVQSLERSKTEADSLAHRSEQDKAGISSDLVQANERNTALLAEQRKLTANVEKLDRTRTELTVELSCKSKDLEALKKTTEAATIELEDLRAARDTERLAKERALEKTGVMDSDLERARTDLREHAENAEALARQLRESERMREQALDTSRAQQRENANRIIEFSQKNARLSSELSAKDDEIASLRRAREDAQHKGAESGKERDDLKNQYLATKVRLQALEDEHEMAVAKFEASRAENDELRVQMKQEIQRREGHIAELLAKHDESIAAMTARLDAEGEDKLQISEATRKQGEERLNRAIAKEKDMHKAQLADMEAKRVQDGEVQRARLGTLAKAMEGLQVELREESAKNSNLTQELAVLKDLAEVGNVEMQERVNYVERERTRERSRLEGQLADVKEQLRQQVEQKQQRDQLMATIEQQLTRERESKFAALQRVRAAEDETATLISQVDALTEETGNQKKDLRGYERKTALIVQNKDAEIIRLTRRNEVLGEAVTRLTAAQGSTSASLSKYFTMGASVTGADDEDTSHALVTDDPGDVLDSDKSPLHGGGSLTSRIDEVVTEYRTSLEGPLSGLSMHQHSMEAPLRAVSSAPGTRSSQPQQAANSFAYVDFGANLPSPVPARAGTAPSVRADTLVSARTSHTFAVLDTASPSPVRDTSPTEAHALTPQPAPHAVVHAMGDQFNDYFRDLSGNMNTVSPDMNNVAHPAFTATPEPITPHSPSSEGGSAADSGSKFTDKLKLSVEKGKGIQLPFSPKKSPKHVPLFAAHVSAVGNGTRVKSAPTGRPLPHDSKENHGLANHVPSVSPSGGKPGASTCTSSDRIKRASSYIKARNSQSATARKPAVF